MFGIEHFDMCLLGGSSCLELTTSHTGATEQFHKKAMNRLQQVMLMHDFVLEYTRWVGNPVYGLEVWKIIHLNWGNTMAFLAKKKH